MDTETVSETSDLYSTSMLLISSENFSVFYARVNLSFNIISSAHVPCFHLP